MALVEKQCDGAIGQLIFNRPEKLNALNSGVLKAFDTVLSELISDPDIRCIIIRGEGRAFSVGYDLEPDNQLFSDGQKSRIRSYDDWQALRTTIDRWLSVWRAPKPVIAAIHGYCMGGATQLAVCCDLTVIARDAVVGWPTIPLGGGLLSPTSAWLIGPKRAKEMSFIAGNRFSGEEAERWGWANHAVDSDDVLAKAIELATGISKMPPDLLRVKKTALNRVFDLQGFAESQYFGAEFDAIAHDSAGCAELVEHVEEGGLKKAMEWYNSQ